jgi:hypothetical protein
VRDTEIHILVYIQCTVGGLAFVNLPGMGCVMKVDVFIRWAIAGTENISSLIRCADHLSGL